MSADPLNVQYVAKLARINLSEEECQRFGQQLGHVMHHIEKLSEVDISDVPPCAHPCDVLGHTRADEAKASLPPAALLDNAPDQAQGQLRVPKVVEDA